MGIKSRIGFGGRSISSDGLVATAGASDILRYFDTSPPNAETTWYAQSRSSLGATVYKLWDEGAVTSASEFWLFGDIKVTANNTFNDRIYLGWGNSATPMGWISLVDSTNLYRLFINGVAVETATAALSVGPWEQWAAKVTLVNGPTGRVEFYTKGDLQNPVLTFDGNTDPTGAGVADASHIAWGRNNDGWANIVAMDPNDGTGVVDPNKLSNFGIETQYPTGDGFWVEWTPDSGGTGWTQINAAPPVDTTYVRAGAVGERSSFTFDLTTAPIVLSVSAIYRILRSGTDAGSNVTVFRRNTAVDYDDAAQAAPGAGNVSGAWDEAPGGGSWTPTNKLATEFGQLSVL